ncbi:methyltransferase domain-containing protein [Kribbella sandramycini]|uniref:Methyltransferase domain-containing protein n=1 Tax=Kribbella sandramycini TaxID=60450 RepID=A0A7Y4P151_9ACTN|nr:methyltransferase domain-containing protein [Kribbella sandramycini]MBB6565482.1 SAM-dependent methyltransferase [Kribbella sandramycini]NOL41749.1 methyltransferase domain-containing protein [Kribbella sandramycini]
MDAQESSVEVTDPEKSADLPDADGSVDSYHAHRLFHQLEDPVPTVAEAYRVLRPGGRFTARGPDFGFLLMDSSDQDLTDVVLLGLESRSVAPRAMRTLRDLLLDAGFRDVEVVVDSAVVTDHAVLAERLITAADAAVQKALITRADADGWLAEQAKRGRHDRFLAILPTLVVSALR